MQVQSNYPETAAKLKQSDRKFRTAFNKRLRVAVKDEMDTVAREGAEPMPASGGLQAHLLAKAKPRLVTRGTKGIDMVFSTNGKGKPDLGSLNNRGRLRHPVYPDSAKPRKQWWWVNQSVQSETWDDAFEASGEPIRRKVAEAFDDVANQL